MGVTIEIGAAGADAGGRARRAGRHGRLTASAARAAGSSTRSSAGDWRSSTASGELRGDPGEALVLHLDGELETPRVVAVGIGDRDRVDLDALRTAGAAAAQALSTASAARCAGCSTRSLPLSLADQARALVEGTILGGYAPGRWKTQDDHPPRPIERIVLGHFDTRGAAGARPSGRRSSPSGRTAPATSRTCRRTSSTRRRSPSTRPSSRPSTSI